MSPLPPRPTMILGILLPSLLFFSCARGSETPAPLFDKDFYDPCISAPRLDLARRYLPYVDTYQGTKCLPEHFDDKYILGKGNYGEVWLSTFSPRAGGKTRFVARKIYYAKPNIELFIRANECAMAAIQHPNVPRLFCVTRGEDGRVGVAMQYAAGIVTDSHGWLNKSELSEWQRYQRTWMSRQWWRVLQAGASLLHLLHSHQLRCFDLKPDNVIVGPHNVWFIDFDMTWHTNSNKDRTAGTRFYTAPEMVFLNPEQKTVRIAPFRHEAPDWYRLGLVIYAMLGECRPFPDDDLWACFQAIKKGVARESLPEGPVGDLVHGLLALTSKFRFGYAEVMDWMAAHPEYSSPHYRPISAQADPAPIN